MQKLWLILMVFVTLSGTLPAVQTSATIYNNRTVELIGDPESNFLIMIVARGGGSPIVSLSMILFRMYPWAGVQQTMRCRLV